MAEGRGEAEWARTSVCLAMYANAHRDPRKRNRPFSPSDFNPYHAKPRASVKVTTDEGIDVLKRIVRGKAGCNG